MSKSSDPVLLSGPGSSYDRELFEGVLRSITEEELEDLALTRNFTGDVVFDVRLRFAGGVLRTVDHSLQRRRRRVYSEV